MTFWNDNRISLFGAVDGLGELAIGSAEQRWLNDISFVSIPQAKADPFNVAEKPVAAPLPDLVATRTVSVSSATVNAADDAFAVDENETLTANVNDDNGAGADSAPNPSTALVTALDGTGFQGTVTVTTAAGGVLTLSDDGSISFDASSGYDFLAAGAVATETFTYTLTDPEGAVDPGVFDATINASSLGADAGAVISGASAGDYSGTAISAAGDINADGIDDIIVGAYLTGADDAGAATVIMGGSFGQGSATLGGAGMLTIVGGGAQDLAGISVSDLGDVNGDGIDDFAVGAYRADIDGRSNAGATAVIFGGANLSGTINLGSLDAAKGFLIEGASANDYSGFDVSAAGDLNNDGLSDIVVSAWPADPDGRFEAGEVYVVFGRVGARETVQVADLGGSDGFRLEGVALDDRAGMSVAGGGDVTGDGIDDLLVGAIHTDPSGLEDAGSVYLVSGRPSFSTFPDLFDFSDSDARIDGAASGDLFGRSVAIVGDVNGDGIDDVIVGAPMVDNGAASDSGAAYILYGSDAGGLLNQSTPFSVSDIDGSNGFVVSGLGSEDLTGLAVAGAGDVNADGIDDIVIGAHLAGEDNRGAAYVIFGSDNARAAVDLVSLNGENGFVVEGGEANAYLGFSVDGVGDVNNDGFDDVAVGSFGVNGSAGETVIVYGQGTIVPQSDTANITIEITGVNDAPIGGDDSFVVANNTSAVITGNVLDNDSDVDVGDVLFVSAVEGGGGSVGNGVGDAINLTNGVVTINADGSLTYEYQGAPGATGAQVDAVAYDVSDGDETTRVNVAFLLGQANTPPAASDDFFATTADVDTLADDPNQSGTFNVLDNDVDADGDPLTVLSVNGDTGLVGQSIFLGSGAVVQINADGEFTYEILGELDYLLAFETIIDEINYEVTDGLNVAAGLLEIEVEGVNDAPVTSEKSISVTDGQAGAADILGQDFDPEGAAITVTDLDATNLAAGAEIFVQDGFLVIDPGTGYRSLADGQTAFVAVTYTVSDDVSYVASLSDQMVGPDEGVLIRTAAANSSVGASVAGIGDVNGDGFADFAVGAPTLNRSDAAPAADGGVYVVFGDGNGIDLNLDLTALDGTNGFLILGDGLNEAVGFSVSAAGDVNGDALDDFIIGAPGADDSGLAIVVFGQTGTVPAVIDTSNGSGFVATVSGINPGDQFGYSVSTAGDFNGDGIDDVIIGDSVGSQGRAYILYGTSDAGPGDEVDVVGASNTELTTLAGYFSAYGFGDVVSSAGDLNGDGFDDVIVGAPNRDYYSNIQEGGAYVFFGSATPSSYQAAEIQALRIAGADLYTSLGTSASGIGDINGDGIDDVAVGGVNRTANSTGDAQAYVIFGDLSFDIGALVDVSSLDGTNGFTITNSLVSGELFYQVSSAGDFNSDGLDDLVIASPGLDPVDNSNPTAGAVIFGTTNGFAASYDLADLDGTNGFRIRATDVVLSNDLATNVALTSVSGAGDVNKDGFDDLVFGLTENASENGGVAIVYGRKIIGDVSGLSTEEIVNVSVTGINDAPIARSDTEDTSPGSTVAGAVLINDFDFDQGDSFAVTAINGSTGDVGQLVTLSSGATVVLAADGTYTYNPNGAFAGLGAGQSAFDEFTYTITDTNGASGGASVIIEVIGVGATITSVDDSFTASISADLLGSVTANDIPDTSQVYAINGARDPIEFGFSYTLTSGASIQLMEDGSFVYVQNDAFNFLLSGQAALDSFSYTLDDGSLTTGPVAQRGLEVTPFSPTSQSFVSGAAQNSFVGHDLTIVGDINGDGLDDFVVSSPNVAVVGALGSGLDQAGAAYIVFGTSAAIGPDFDLGSLDGSNGFAFEGESAYDGVGYSVGDAGDVNGDGIDDIIIGAATQLDAVPDLGAQSAYVLFGSDQGFVASLSASDLDGTNGFSIQHGTQLSPATSGIGGSVDGAGDVNGDGFDDLIVGAQLVSEAGVDGVGRGFVIFGGNSLGASVDTSTLGAGGGFTVSVGADQALNESKAGYSVSSAGDINGDGIDDVMVSVPYDNQSGGIGEVIVVFGQSGAVLDGVTLNKTNVDGTNGFRIVGRPQDGDRLGRSVTDLGDVNGDGFDDILIADRSAAGSAGLYAGKAHVILGQAGGFASSISVENLDGSNGFTIEGASAYDALGEDVDYAGDVNGDGFDDILIYASGVDIVGGRGVAYVIYGTDAGFSSSLNVRQLNGVNGVTVYNLGFSSGDYVTGVGGGGDINGDGFDDLLLANVYGYGAIGSDLGQAIVVLGDETPVSDLTSEVTITIQGPSVNRSSTNDVLSGLAGADVIDGGSGDDTLNGWWGDDTLLGGEGQDQLYGGQGSDLLIADGTLEEAAALLASLGLDAPELLDVGRATNGDDVIEVVADGSTGVVIDALGGDDEVYGSDFDDQLLGNAGADALYGGEGQDLLIADGTLADAMAILADLGLG